MKIKPLLAFLAASSAAVSLQAVTINASSAVTNVFGDSAGNQLTTGSLIEVGLWDGSSFSLLESFAAGDGGVPGGLFVSSAPLDTITLGIVGQQLAFRWYETTDGSGAFGLAYFDKALNAEWSVKSGDGSGSDPESNNIDIGDLTDGAGTSLISGAVLVSGSLTGGPDSTFGNPVFAVPEPATYAALLGLLALGAVLVRRRK